MHENFYKELCEDPETKLKYDPEIGFFQPHSDPWFASDWKYIFTYEVFFNYLKNIAIPDNIQAEIDNAVHYLFIGFNFDKFYNTLILFLLKLNNKEK